VARSLADAWALHIGKPTSTRDGPFEDALRAVLAAAGIDAPDDLHRTVTTALRRGRNSLGAGELLP
jgi:hypothetical protein